MANRNRTAGHNYERKIKRELTELIGGSDWRTTREQSRAMDNAKIDLIDINGIGWFTVQCKTSTNLPKLEENLFKFNDKPNILFWKRTIKKKDKFVSKGEYVIMRKEDFYELVNRG